LIVSLYKAFIVRRPDKLDNREAVPVMRHFHSRSLPHLAGSAEIALGEIQRPDTAEVRDGTLGSGNKPPFRGAIAFDG